MSWYSWHRRKAKFKKEAALHGEWWIVDGQAEFADGDVGDLNHEGAAMLRAQGIILFEFDEMLEAQDVDWDEFRTKVCKEFIQEAENDPVKVQEYIDALQESYEDNNQEFFWSYICEPKGVERPVFEMAEDMCDIRAVAMQHWGYKRMARTLVETYSLTSADLTSIVDGIWDAYGEELEMAENSGRDITFTIEVDSTRSYYADIPISVLKNNNVSALSGYRDRY